MIDIAHIKENLEHYKKKLGLKGYTGNLDEIISGHESKNIIQVELDDLKNKKNVLKKIILIFAILSPNYSNSISIFFYSLFFPFF